MKLDYYGRMTRPTLLCATAFAILLSGVSAGAQQAQAPASASSAPTKVIPKTKTSRPAANSPSRERALAEDLRRHNEQIAFHDALIAEMHAQRKELAQAFALMLDAAQRLPSDRLFERAVELGFAAQQGNDALLAARKWEQMLPTSTRAHRYALSILIALQRLDEIGEPLRLLLRHSSDEERATHLVLLPGYFARSTDRKAAAQAVQRALTSDLADTRSAAAAWAAIARMHAFAGDNGLALEALRKSAALSPDSDDAALAALQIGGSISRDVWPLIQTRLAAQPGAGLRMAAIRAFVEQQNYQTAYDQASLLTQEKPALAEGWYYKGSLELHGNRIELAQQSLTTFLSLLDTQSKDAAETAGSTPTTKSEALLQLAQIAEQKKDYQRAAEYLEQIANPAYNARIVTRRASIAAAQGNVEEARALLASIPATTTEALRQRFNAELQMLRDRKLHIQAMEVAAQAAQALPDDPNWRYEQAMEAEKLGRVAEMEQLLRELIDRHPRYHPPYNALGYSLADRNVSLSEARRLIAKALEFAPDDAYIVDSMGWVEFRSGNLSEARRLLEKAFEGQPDAEIAAHLGEVLWTQGDVAAAKAIWKRGLQLNPTNATLLKTLQRFRVQL